MTPGPSIETSLPSVNAPKATPNVLGSDGELGNFVLGLERENGTGAIASRALLREIEGVPGLADAAPGQLVGSSSHAESAKYAPQDWGRKYLPQSWGSYLADSACEDEPTSWPGAASASPGTPSISRNRAREAIAPVPFSRSRPRTKLPSSPSEPRTLGVAFGAFTDGRDVSMDGPGVIWLLSARTGSRLR